MRNAKVHSIFFEDLPITSAAFTGVDQVIRSVFGIRCRRGRSHTPNQESRRGLCTNLFPVHVAARRSPGCLSARQDFPVRTGPPAKPLPNPTPAVPPPDETLFFFLFFQAIVTGRRSFFYSYDVATGKVMKIPRIFSSGRAEKHVETFAASPDGQWLAFIGSGGDLTRVHRPHLALTTFESALESAWTRRMIGSGLSRKESGVASAARLNPSACSCRSELIKSCDIDRPFKEVERWWSGASGSSLKPRRQRPCFYRREGLPAAVFCFGVKLDAGGG